MDLQAKATENSMPAGSNEENGIRPGAGSSFMEDYTYHMADNGLVLGAHMLEVDPSIAEIDGEKTISVEPLGIGNRKPPARMKFVSRTGDAICVSLVDLGDRLRMICQTLKL